MSEKDVLEVLIVDDDPSVRRALVRLLERDPRLRTQQAEDGLAALKLLEHHPVDIVISDEVMPEINGVRLLQTVRARWPGTRRVLHTGHPDAAIVIDAINRGGIDKALMKGVPSAQLRMEIGELVDECFRQALSRADASGRTSATPPEALVSEVGKPLVMIVAEELAVGRSYEASLREHGFETQTSQRVEDALGRLQLEHADVVVLDIGGREVNASDFLRRLRAFDLDCPVVVTAARGAVPDALEALRDGAYRYLVHPVRSDALGAVVRQAALLRRVAELRRRALEEADRQAAWQVGDRAALEVRFRQAIDELFMVYQPIVSWSERRPVGYEALVRSAEPTLPHPGALFDAAARLERTDELGRAIRRLSPKPFAGGAGGRLFLNVHVDDLADDDFLEGALPSMADRVVLEITERAALDSLGDASARLAELRARGFHIAIDDLGAGYAGLSSFALLEPDIVKLDMTLIRDIDRAPLKRRLVAGLREACTDLGVALIAEGVETTAERDTLIELGCDLFQGYLFARPGPAFAEPSWG